MDLLNGLRAFVATAQTESFTEAATRLGISNRLTSKYVAQLEEYVGTRLLQRTTRKVGLTAAGEELLSRAPVLLDELDDLMGTVSEKTKGLSGELRIATSVDFGTLFINDILSAFCCAHPNISLDLRLKEEHVDLAAEGIDLAFRVGTPEIATLKTRKLGEITSMLVASPEYLAIHGEPENLEQLAEHKCIIDSNRKDFNRWRFYNNDKEYSFHPRNKKIQVNSARLATDWAKQGRGIALVPSFVLHDALKDGSLIPILKNFKTSNHPVYAVYLETRVMSKKVRALIDFAVEAFENRLV